MNRLIALCAICLSLFTFAGCGASASQAGNQL